MREAGKQVQQQQEQEGPSGFHSSGQTATVAQYLQRSAGQYPPQAQQSGLPSYLAAAGQHASALPGSASQEPKSGMAAMSYQVSLHYTCAAPCFDQ